MSDQMRKMFFEWGVALVALAGSAPLAGCAGDDNHAPEFFPIEDAVFRVNRDNKIDVSAADADGDTLRFDFKIEPAPPTPTRGAAASPTVTKIGGNDARFTWTPGIADAGSDADNTETYTVTFTVSDGNGGSDEVAIALQVVNDGQIGGGGDLVFTEPVGAGTSVDRVADPSACAEIRVAVKADLIDSGQVEIEAPELPDRATLSPAGNGKTKTLSWCPSDAQLDEKLSWTLTFRAREAGSDLSVTKRFTVRFRRDAASDCTGEPPRIEHTPPGDLGGPLNYDLRATIIDDVGFKSPPIVAFSVDERVDTNNTSGWQIVQCTPEGADQWLCSVPNQNLAEGACKTLYYQFSATDDDDPDGTRCDNTTDSESYKIQVCGGRQVDPNRAYGYCDGCVSDAQCGGADDLCHRLRGEAFCGSSCEVEECPASQVCVAVTSVDGVEGSQCVPADLNCGQICVDDANDMGTRNDTPATATPLQPGVATGLSICDPDEDYFAVLVEQGQSIRARIEFDVEGGDLDLAMSQPNVTDRYPYQSLSYDQPFEEVYEPCAGEAGTVTLGVVGYEGARNGYDLTVEVGVGACNLMCTDDAYDTGATPNDTQADAWHFDDANLPDGEILTLCSGDSDFFSFEAAAGDLVDVAIFFDVAAGDLNLRAYRDSGELIDESEDVRDVEFLPIEAPIDGTYIVEVYGATPSIQNTYELLIDKATEQMCQATRECPRDQFCAGNVCADAACFRVAGCGAGHSCRTPRSGQAPEGAGGQCGVSCAADLDCRGAHGYRCKAFEDFTRSCAIAGASLIGERCGSFRDCGGDMICLGTSGGYCAAAGSACDVGCGAGALCADFGGISACMKRCEGDGDCRVAEGYTCQAVPGGRACLPS